MLTMLFTIEDLEAADRITILYRRYNRILYQEAYSLLHDQSDAEDALADTFEALLARRKVPSPDEPGVKALLITILRRKAIDIYNTRQKKAHVPLDDENVGARTESLSEVFMLQEAIAQLPAKEREVLILFMYDGYTTAEIAAQKGVKQDTVQKWIKHIKEKLKKSLEYN